MLANFETGLIPKQIMLTNTKQIKMKRKKQQQNTKIKFKKNVYMYKGRNSEMNSASYIAGMHQ